MKMIRVDWPDKARRVDIRDDFEWAVECYRDAVRLTLTDRALAERVAEAVGQPFIEVPLAEVFGGAVAKDGTPIPPPEGTGFVFEKG